MRYSSTLRDGTTQVACTGQAHGSGRFEGLSGPWRSKTVDREVGVDTKTFLILSLGALGRRVLVG
jgi:hypothetical protein